MLNLMLTTCVAPIIINLTNSWNESDNKVLTRAKYVCAVEYQGCLKKFVKKEEQLYNALCGGNK